MKFQKHENLQSFQNSKIYRRCCKPVGRRCRLSKRRCLRLRILRTSCLENNNEMINIIKIAIEMINIIKITIEMIWIKASRQTKITTKIKIITMTGLCLNNNNNLSIWTDWILAKRS